MRSSARKALDDVYEWTERKYRALTYRRSAVRRLKRLHGGAPVKKEYFREVVPYWRRFGIRPAMLWYRLYAFHAGRVDPRYIPDDIWFDRVLPYYSNASFRRFGEDKNYLWLWCPEARRPRTVAACVAGVYYDGAFNVITREEAVDRCVAEKRLVIKPSVDSGEGRLIRFFDGPDCDAGTVSAAFDALGGNFVAQEIIVQHEALARLHPGSLNTVRIITFFFENQVRVLSAILRVGGSGSRVDNIGAGGFACSVGPDGRLARFALNRKSEKRETSETGVRFDSVTIPSYGAALETVKRLHQRMAHFKIIGWDIAVGEDGQPILIEFNTAPGQNQLCCGPTFGDLTERVLEDVFLAKSLRNSRN